MYDIIVHKLIIYERVYRIIGYKIIHAWDDNISIHLCESIEGLLFCNNDPWMYKRQQ